MIFWGVLLLSISTALAQYTGHQVLKVIPTDSTQLRYLQHLSNTNTKLDFLQEPSVVGHQVLVMVPPHYKRMSHLQFISHGLTPQVYIEDIQREVNAEKQRLDERFKKGSRFLIDDFNTYEDIMMQLEEWYTSCGAIGLFCEKEDIGKTYEGRQMTALKVSSGGLDKPIIWLDSAIHAREWLAPATVLKIMDHVFSNYASDYEIQDLLGKYDFYFLPVVNPDGYAYSWTNERLWRKNRSPNDWSGFGTDLNRNFDYFWCEDGASHLPIASTYCGSSAASELETQAIQNKQVELQNSYGIRAYVTFHSFGRYILFPYGHTVNDSKCVRTSDHDDLMRGANAFAEAAIEAVNDYAWKRGTICETIYAASGSADTYAYGVAGVKYTYTAELRGLFFMVDPAQIQVSFDQMWPAIIALINETELIAGTRSL